MHTRVEGKWIDILHSVVYNMDVKKVKKIKRLF